MQVGCKELVLPLNSLMRILTFILSFYIGALSIVPCSDGMTQDSAHPNLEVSTDGHNHDHSDHQDDCTPFCTCVCCGSIVTLPFLQSLIGKNFALSTEYSSQYNCNYSFDYSEGVWHPPSIS